LVAEGQLIADLPAIKQIIPGAIEVQLIEIKRVIFLVCMLLYFYAEMK